MTAAQVFGRRAPVLVDNDTLRRMSPGSVVVDLAAENGGNVAGVSSNAINTVGGVTVVTWHHLESQVPETASSLFSANVTHLIETFRDDDNSLVLPLEDEIVKACLITRGGRICHERLLPGATKSDADSAPRQTEPAGGRDRSPGSSRNS